MISQKLQDAINVQINAERSSAQLYLGMSLYCEEKSFKGFAKWLKIQAQEETRHAEKLIELTLDRKGKVELKGISAPPMEYSSITQVFEQSLVHEKSITHKLNALFEQARSEKDHATEIALQWFITEQIEEEAQLNQLLDHLHAIGEQGGGIWYLDSKIGKRDPNS